MHNRLYTAALGLAAAVASGSVSAASAPAPAPWEVSPMESGLGCYVAKPVGGDVTLAFHYLPKDREFRVLVAAPGWDEWTRRGSQLIPVDLRMTLPGGERTASTSEGFAMALDGGVETIAGVWRWNEGDALRGRLRQATRISLSSSGTPVGSYPLKGSAAAIDALMKCADGLGQS
jgi:hypothetical protein